MSKNNSRRTRESPHVRLYDYELDSDAYRSLSPVARCLLVEMRALYKGQENRVYMSRREIERRLNVGKYLAEKARDELLDRGFIKVLVPGSFTQKNRHATEYALLNEPLDGESVARKDYMSWSCPKNHGVDEQPRRGRSVTPTNGKRPPKSALTGLLTSPVKPKFALSRGR